MYKCPVFPWKKQTKTKRGKRRKEGGRDGQKRQKSEGQIEA